MKRLFAIVVLVLILLALVWFMQPGSQLVVNHPEKSDAIVVLAGTEPDVRYRRGMELLRAGYAQHLVLDAATGELFGHSLADLAREFVASTAGADLPKVSVCPVDGDSTKDEAPQVNTCLQQLQPPPHSVIVGRSRCPCGGEFITFGVALLTPYGFSR